MSHGGRSGRLLQVLIALTLALPTLVVAHPAWAGPGKSKKAESKKKTLSQILTGAAKVDFEAGKLLASDGDYAGALVKFGSAYEASKEVRLLWNLAFCHKNLRHYAKVLSILRRYLDEGDSLLTAAERSEAQNLVGLIEPFTTRAAFQVTPEGAAITVDGEPVGTSPLPGPVVLDIGERRIRVTLEGYRPLEKMLAVGGTSEVTFRAELEKEVHEGRLVVNAPPHAQILLDGKEVGTGKLDQLVSSGGHQLRVVAPRMRPYQSEIVITDKETRSVDVVLEAAAPPAKPRLRVAVGCVDSNPRGPEDGLVVRLDNTDVLTPALIKRRHDDRLDKDVVDHVEYEVPSGQHTVGISLADCQPWEETVTIAPDGGRIIGALRSDRSFLFRGPLGSPGWYRVALGVWMPSLALRHQDLSKPKQVMPDDYAGGLGSLTGAMLEVGWVTRWFALFVSGALATGTFNRGSHFSREALPESTPTSLKQVFSLRFGPRFPFNVAALSLGPYESLHIITVDKVTAGLFSPVLGGYIELDVQPLCDWGVFALGNLGHSVIDTVSYLDRGLTIGIMYQPSSRCHMERKTNYGLTLQ